MTEAAVSLCYGSVVSVIPTPLRNRLSDLVLSMRVVVQVFLGRFGLQLQRVTPLPNPILLWDEDAHFLELHSEIRNRTLVDKSRCFILYEYVRHAAGLAGDVAEIGVYKGGTARLLARMMPQRTVHLFDTFQGMPETDPIRDLHGQGDFADTSLKSVQAFLSGLPNVQFYPGLFPDTAAPVAAKTFALVHVDADIYSSVQACCAFFYPRLVVGGVMVFDDYGFRSCPGARAAVDEFFLDRPECPVYLPTGQCIVVRMPST
jgi:O-methyltransferase